VKEGLGVAGLRVVLGAFVASRRRRLQLSGEEQNQVRGSDGSVTGVPGPLGCSPYS